MRLLRVTCVSLLILAAVAVPGAAAGLAPAPAADGAAAADSFSAADAGGASADVASSTVAASSTAASSATSSASTGSLAAAQSSGSDDIVENVVYRRTDDGELEAEISYDVPSELTALEFQFERDDLEVVETAGFERSETPDLQWNRDPDGPAFTWDGHTDDPSVVVRHAVPRDTPATYAGGTEDWAVVLRPSTSTRWRYDGTEPEFGYDAAVEGEGVAGEQFLVLGPHEVHERTVDGERIRLVVPEAADTASEPERILDSLADASERLDVGRRSDVVTVVATPTEGVEWAHRGLSLGPDARVAADVSVDRAADLWVHEYVHTRQDRAATTAETQWLVEATAEYYAATAALERGQVDFADYRRALAKGGSGAASEAVLAEPDSWQAQANYRKGALVVAATDRELRAATDGDATFQDVVAAWNGADEFDGADLAAELEALGGSDVRAYAETHAETTATPELWDERRHRRVFDVDLADVTVAEPTVEVRSAGAASPLADGEQALSGNSDDAVAPAATDAGSDTESDAGSGDRLVATVDVENDGDAPGRYRIPLRVDGTTVAVETGELAPGEARTVRFEHELASSGEHAVQVGSPDETRRVTVEASGGRPLEELAALDGLTALATGPAAADLAAQRRALAAGGSSSTASGSSVAAEGHAAATASPSHRAGSASATGERSGDDGESAAGTDPMQGRLPTAGVLAALLGLLGVAGLVSRP